MNLHHATKTIVIGPRRHLLIGMLMLGILLPATDALGQKMRFYPIRTAPLGSPPGTIGDPVTPVFNSVLDCWELQVFAGIEVHIDVEPSGWGDAPGSPTLGGLQATVSPAGYNSGEGGGLVPKGWPGDPQDGIFYTKFKCTGNGDWCSSPFDTTCGGGANGVCEFNPDWVMPQCAKDLPCNITPTLHYAWADAAQVDCVVDDGEIKTLGGWILNVPSDAAGTYVIAFNPDPNNSFMASGPGASIPGLELTAACITVLENNEPGRCCSDIGPNVVCEEVTPQICFTRPEPRLFAAGETCDGECGCPTCLSDADCDDGDACTANLCDECGQCVFQPSCPEIRFYPIRMAPLGSPPGTVGTAVTPDFNSDLGCWEVRVIPGVEVDIDLQGFAWGGSAGSRMLGAIQGYVISAAYDNDAGGPVGDLNPKGWPGSPGDGAYQAEKYCTPQSGGDGSPCSPPFDTTCDNGSNGICVRNPDWIMPPCAGDFAVMDTTTLDFAWATADFFNCNVDPGSVKTFGGLIIEVPSDADGTYIIDIDPDPNNSFMVDISGEPIPGVTFTPACITVEVPDFNRYVAFEKGSSDIVAYRLDMVSSLFHPDAVVSGWVGEPDANDIAGLEADPVERTWDEETVYITGCEITPVATFELHPMISGGAFLPPIILQTTAQPGASKFWGDLVGSFNGVFWSAAQGVVNIDDVFSVIKTWLQEDGAPKLPRTDVVPQELNRVINFNDVLFVNFAFQGNYYPFGCPDDPCQDNMANPCP